MTSWEDKPVVDAVQHLSSEPPHLSGLRRLPYPALLHDRARETFTLPVEHMKCIREGPDLTYLFRAYAGLTCPS